MACSQLFVVQQEGCFSFSRFDLTSVCLTAFDSLVWKQSPNSNLLHAGLKPNKNHWCALFCLWWREEVLVWYFVSLFYLDFKTPLSLNFLTQVTFVAAVLHCNSVVDESNSWNNQNIVHVLLVLQLHAICLVYLPNLTAVWERVIW